MMNVKKYVWALLCLYLSISIHEHLTAQALRVGEKLPPALWSLPLKVANHPAGNPTLTLKEYKDKLIILDFWATWCAPCIKSLNKLDTLQKEFGTQVAILPVTYEDQNKALAMIRKRGWHLPTAVEDTILKAYFPYYLIPHQVWVKEGKVLSITGAAYSTSVNIEKILRDETVKMIQKTDVTDMSKDTSSFPYFKSELSSRIRNGASRISRHPKGIKAYNISLKDLLIESYLGLYALGQLHSMLVWEVSDSLKSQLTAQGDGYGYLGQYEKDILFEQWLDQNLFCYTLTFDKHIPLTREMLYETIRSEVIRLIKYLKGVDCQLTRRPVEHLILVKIPPSGSIPDKKPGDEGIKIENKPVKEFLLTFSYLMQRPILADEAIKGNLSLQLDLSSKDIPSLQAQLRPYGFDLTTRMVESDVILITPVKPAQTR